MKIDAEYIEYAARMLAITIGDKLMDDTTSKPASGFTRKAWYGKDDPIGSRVRDMIAKNYSRKVST